MKTQIKVVIASSVGSILEMYDFVIYGFFATVLASLFFPKSDHLVGLLATFGIFAVGYFARPLGGWIFAHISDKYGRRTGLVYSVACMGVPIFLMGILPTYHSIGFIAPVLLLIFRIMQGLSVGGEFPGATSFITEYTAPRRRGLVASWLFFGINLGIVLATIVGALVTNIFSTTQVDAWAWRIPFILGGLLALVSYYIRRHLQETPLFKQLEAKQKIARLPLSEVFKTAKKPMFIGFGLVAVMAAAVGTLFLFMPAYLHRFVGISLDQALVVNTVNVLIFTLLIPVAGALSDLWGRKPMLFIGALFFLVGAYPLYWIISQNIIWLSMLSMIVLGAFAALIIGPIASTLAELFPTPIRTSGIATSYNLSFALFGGMAPLTLTALLGATHNLASPAFFLMSTAIVTLVFTCFLKESKASTLPG